MLSSKITKTSDVQRHNGIPHVRTEIVILSPITDESMIRNQMVNQIALVEKLIAEINTNFKESLAEDFGASVEQIKSTIRNI